MESTLLQALIAHFDSVFEGPNGDYPAVFEALSGIVAAQAAWKPGPDRNSIWQIVDHLTASKLWLIDMLEKGQADAPIWSEPGGGENAWQTSLVRLREAHVRMKEVFSQIPEAQLLNRPNPGEPQTLLELLASSAAHEAHHAGQIDYLKGLQSAAS